MDPRYFSVYNLNIAGRKQKFGYAKNVQFGRKRTFRANPVGENSSNMFHFIILTLSL